MTKGKKYMYGVPFTKVDGTVYDIQDIVVKNTYNADGDPGEAAFTLSWWDTKNGYQYALYKTDAYADDGSSADGTEINKGLENPKYYWVDKTSLFALVPIGWNKYGDGTLSTTVDHSKVFNPGEAFYITSKTSVREPNITIAGAVPPMNKSEERIDITGLTKGKKYMLAHPFGITTDIQDIVVRNDYNADGDPGEAAFTLSWWDTKNGYQYALYKTDAYADDGSSADGTEINKGLENPKYYWVDKTSLFALVPEGWNKYGDGTISTIVDHSKVFGPGEGFYITSKTSVRTPVVSFVNPFYESDK